MLDAEKRTWAQVSVGAIRNNYENMRLKLPEGCKFLGVVKANAYGHGAVQVAKMLQEYGCDYLAVACLDEAEELRAAGLKLPILILGATVPEFAQRVADCGATQSIGSLEAAKEFSHVLQKAGKTVKVHIKLETGMGRTGFNVKHGDVSEAVQAVLLPGLDIEGVFTHFAVSDEPDGEEYTRAQFKLFMDATEKIEKDSGIHFSIKHCANSGVMVNYPDMYLDMVRPGIALYGVFPGAHEKGLELTPAMELKSRIVELHDLEPGETVSYGCTFKAERKTRVAVLPIGYADGLHRVLSGRLEVLVCGVRCKQIGRICMDMCMVDVTDVPNVQVGDVATIFGKDNEAIICVTELAEKAGTISYEILSNIAARVPRFYF